MVGWGGWGGVGNREADSAPLMLFHKPTLPSRGRRVAPVKGSQTSEWRLGSLATGPAVGARCQKVGLTARRRGAAVAPAGVAGALAADAVLVLSCRALCAALAAVDIGRHQVDLAACTPIWRHHRLQQCCGVQKFPTGLHLSHWWAGQCPLQGSLSSNSGLCGCTARPAHQLTAQRRSCPTAQMHRQRSGLQAGTGRAGHRRGTGVRWVASASKCL